MAVLAPMPSASVRMIVITRAGDLRNWRNAMRIFCIDNPRVSKYRGIYVAKGQVVQLTDSVEDGLTGRGGGGPSPLVGWPKADNGTRLLLHRDWRNTDSHVYDAKQQRNERDETKSI